MSYLPAAAHRLFARQHGAASLSQLLGSGLTAKQIENHVANDALIGVLRGAYRSPSVGETEAMRCAEICLARPEVVISGPTAGRIHGFRKLPADRRTHITAPCGANPSTALPRVVTFHTKAVRCQDIIQRSDGIRVFSRPRTAMDLARFLDSPDLQSVVEQAMHDGRHDAAEMIAVGADWTFRRRWVRSYLSSILLRLDGPPAESHGEFLVGELLRRRGVGGLVRQYQLVAADRTMRFDLAVPRLRWAIEIDLFPTHEETVGAASDRMRDLAAASECWTVSRLTRQQYHHELASSIDHLVNEYRRLDRHRLAARVDDPPPPDGTSSTQGKAAGPS